MKSSVSSLLEELGFLKVAHLITNQNKTTTINSRKYCFLVQKKLKADDNIRK